MTIEAPIIYSLAFLHGSKDSEIEEGILKNVGDFAQRILRHMDATTKTATSIPDLKTVYRGDDVKGSAQTSVCTLKMPKLRILNRKPKASKKVNASLSKKAINLAAVFTPQGIILQPTNGACPNLKGKGFETDCRLRSNAFENECYSWAISDNRLPGESVFEQKPATCSHCGLDMNGPCHVVKPKKIMVKVYYYTEKSAVRAFIYKRWAIILPMFR